MGLCSLCDHFTGDHMKYQVGSTVYEYYVVHRRTLVGLIIELVVLSATSLTGRHGTFLFF